MGSSFFLSIFVLAVGTGFYVAYKTSVSEILIDKIFHFKMPGIMIRHSKKNCAFEYFRKLGVAESQLISAFRLIRDKYFVPSASRIFYRRHSEIHILYETATVFFLGAVIHSEMRLLFVVLGVVILFLGFSADKNVCEDECACFKSLKKVDEIKKDLKNAELL